MGRSHVFLQVIVMGFGVESITLSCFVLGSACIQKVLCRPPMRTGCLVGKTEMTTCLVY